ncbi:MAG: hypothetical protein GXO66_00935 [Euryarchaeota archaeon]|nr:hypothetical protein [Euryarchaeota archaeon]
MVTGAPGTGKGRIAARLLGQLVSRGEEAVYITTEVSPMEIEESLGLGKELSRVLYIDGTCWGIEDYRKVSELRGRVSQLHSRRLDSLLAGVQRLSSNIIVNSLSSFLFRVGDRRQIKRLRERFSYTRSMGGVLLFTVHEYVHPPHVYSSLESGADVIIKTEAEAGPAAGYEEVRSSGCAVVLDRGGALGDGLEKMIEKLFKLDKNGFSRTFYIRRLIYRLWGRFPHVFSPPIPNPCPLLTPAGSA